MNLEASRDARTMGRPTKFCPRKAQIVLEALRGGVGMERAALAAGITKRTVFNWIYAARDGRPGFEGFDAQVDRARRR